MRGSPRFSGRLGLVILWLLVPLSGCAKTQSIQCAPGEQLNPDGPRCEPIGTGGRGGDAGAGGAGGMAGAGGAGGGTGMALEWGEAEPFEIDNSGTVSLAVDAEGRGVAAWLLSDGQSQVDIWANRFAQPDGWGTAGPIEMVDDLTLLPPHVAMDSAGNAVAVFALNDGTRWNIWANRSALLGGWGTAELVEDASGTAPASPRVAMDEDGNALVVWEQSDGTHLSIFSNRFTPFGLWGEAEAIETETEDASQPRIAMNAEGDAVAVWRQSDGAVTSIWSNRFTASTGAWGQAEPAETNLTDANSPDVAIDQEGRALAVWRQSEGGRQNIWANRFTPSTGWGEATRIETQNLGDALTPEIAMSPQGDAVAAWRQSDGSRFNIWSNRFDASSGRWGDAQTIDDSEDDAISVAIAIDSEGRAVAVWTQGGNVWSNRSTASGDWGLANEIESNPGTAFSPNVGIDGQGRALAVWAQGGDIWSNQLR